MKRWRPPRPLILIALLLLVGAVVNVAVAWGIAATADTGDSSLNFARTRTQPNWVAPYRPEITVFFSGRGWRRARVASDSLVVATGFPCASLRAVRSGLTIPGLLEWSEPPPAAPIAQRGVEAPQFLRARGWFDLSYGYIPTDPVFPGFAINTLFYTGVVGAILALPLSVFPIRRRLRARRGRCPKCGYDLAGLTDPAAACPECGDRR